MKFFLLTIIFLNFSTPYLDASEELQTTPFFQASKKQHYHISVAAVLFDENGRVGCLHFKENSNLCDIYSLIQESMEDNETPLMALQRRLKEEFGEATAQPLAYVGSASGHLAGPCCPYEKTILYIACQLIDWHCDDQDIEDDEETCVIEWFEPDKLISIMQYQGILFKNRIDSDDSEMIKRALPYIR